MYQGWARIPPYIDRPAPTSTAALSAAIVQITQLTFSSWSQLHSDGFTGRELSQKRVVTGVFLLYRFFNYGLLNQVKRKFNNYIFNCSFFFVGFLSLQ